MATDRVTAFIDDQWIIEANKIDNSTSGKILNPFTPTQFKPGNYYNSATAPQYIHTYDASSAFIFPQEAYIQTQLQLVDSSTSPLTTYPNGAPVALVPNVAATLFELIALTWNGTSVEIVPNTANAAIFLKALVNYSFDSLLSGIYQVNAMILDAAGQTQNTSGFGNVGTGQQATSTFIPGAGFYTPAKKYVIGFALETSGTGPVYTMPGYGMSTTTSVVPTSTAAPVTFTGTGSVIATLSSVTITGPLNTGAVIASVSGTPTNLASITGSATLAGASTAGLLSTSGSAANSTAGGFYPILLQSNDDNTSFWLRQQLTNQPAGAGTPGTGVLTNLRIYMKDILNSLAGFDKFETGGTWVLRTVPNSQLSQIVQHAQYYPGTNASAVGDALIWLNTWTMYMPSKTPSPLALERLNAQFVPGFAWQHAWTSYFPQDVVEITGNSFTLAFQIPEGLVDWVVIQGVPTSYLADQKHNVQCSIWNVPTDGSCIVSNAQLNYQSANFPDPAYGQDPADNIRMYQTFLELCDRTNYELFGPPITYQQWLYSYCYLVFDVRGRKGASTQQSNIKPKITFKNAVSVPTTVRVIGIKKQLGERRVVQRTGDLSTVRVNYFDIV